MPKSVSVVICALNEDRNIGLLLHDLGEQVIAAPVQTAFAVSEIVVVSDGSTDNTAPLVKTASSRDARIRLIENPTRLGKIFSLDKALQTISADFVLLFDADVRLTPSTISNLLAPLLAREYKLVGGNPVPVRPDSLFNVAQQAAMFSWHLLQAIKKRQPLSIYSAHGRILCASRSLYSTLNITHLSTPGDDQYMYLKSGHDFMYTPDAIVYFKLTGTMADYLKQNIRFRRAKTIRAVDFTADTTANEFAVPNKLSMLIFTAMTHPWRCVCWAFLYGYGAVQFKMMRNSSGNGVETWGDARSSK